MPTFHTQLESPSFTNTKQRDSSPCSPRTQPSWKSVFRFPSSSSKKLPINGSPLLLQTQALPVSAHSSVSHTPVTPTPSLNAVSYLSDQRTSYNSSLTQSSDSNGSQTSRGPYVTLQSRAYSHYSQPKSPEALSAATLSRSRQHTKSERTRPSNTRLPPSPRIVPLTADPSQVPSLPTPSRSRTNGPLSPKSVSASASRFIRRVASAPNAKGLFSMGSRSSYATTKNGLLAPSDNVPPLPQLVSSSSDQGEDSLETVSSGSSRGRISRLNTPMTAPVNGLNGVASQRGLPPPAGKVAFRRTYSSNSIKVRQVR